MQYPSVIKHKESIFERKECEECGTSFWSVNKQNKKCGTDACNRDYELHVAEKEWDTIRVLNQFKHYFSSKENQTLYDSAHELRRARSMCKYNKTNMNFVCAGISAFDTLIELESKKKKFGNKLLVNCQFCYRFKDKQNVSNTGRHNSGFYMLGLHCFESKKKFNSNWISLWIEHILTYFIEVLQIDPKKIFLHADSWSDGKHMGPSIQIYVNGCEIGNVVFTSYDLINKKPLEYKYLDVGLGLERIVNLVSVKKTEYFDSLIKDHMRSLVFALRDKISPSKIGIGYNIRKLIEPILVQYIKQNKLNCIGEDIKRINDQISVLMNEPIISQKKLAQMIDIIEYQRVRFENQGNLL